MRAIILAAGEGSRLRPLTVSTPKPMLKVANRPILHYAVEALVKCGVQDIDLVVGYHREKVQGYFQDGHKFGARIRYAFQEALLGTAHALVQVDLPKEPFLVLGGDNVIDGRLVRDAMDAKGDTVVVAKESAHPSKYGVIQHEVGAVRHIEEKPPTHARELVSTGVYRFPEKAASRFHALVREGHVGITSILNEFVREGQDVRVARTTGTWLDALYPWDLLWINARLLGDAKELPPRGAGISPTASLTPPFSLGHDVDVGPNCVISPSSSLGDNVTLGPGCVVENCIVGSDVQIGAGSILTNSIVADGVRVGPRFTAISGPSEARTVDGYHALRDFGCVIGEDTRIGGAVAVAPGVLIESGATVAHGKFVRENVGANTIIV